MHRPTAFAAASFLTLLLVATSTFGQVRITTQLEKARVLRGEPIIISVTVVNVGNRDVVEGMTCEDDLKFEVVGQTRRAQPALLGCLTGSGSGFSCGFVDHPSPLAPGGTRIKSFVLKGYDLAPGRYQIAASGSPRFEWFDTKTALPDTNLSQTLTVEVVPSTSQELRATLQPLVDAAAGAGSARFLAADALMEAAPAFLAREIAVYAQQGIIAAMEALRRMDTDESIATLRRLVDDPQLSVRRPALTALAYLGRPSDAPMFAAILSDKGADLELRSIAALALAKIGGDVVVAQLTSAAAGAPVELRKAIVTALGNTRSPLAPPAILGIADDDTSNEMCIALQTLTHRRWCNGSPLDHGALARQWTREWDARAPGTTMLFGLADCAALEDEERRLREESNRTVRVAPEPVIGPSTESPRITALVPPRPAAGASLTIRGFGLGARDSRAVRVRFTQGATVDQVPVGGTGASSKDGVDGEQYLQVGVPASLRAGSYRLEIAYRDVVVARSSIDIVAPTALTLVRAYPARPHPSQPVEIESMPPPLSDDTIELTDSKGVSWPATAYPMPMGFFLILPARIPEGDAVVRARRSSTLSAPLVLHVTTAPMPLPESAIEYMKPSAAGQFTMIWPDAAAEFELARVDRVEFEFQQDAQRIVTDAVDERHRRVRVPASLKPGDSRVRIRTWIEQTASEWSAPVTWQVLSRAAPVAVASITSAHRSVWSGQGGPQFIFATPGQTFELSGHVPVAARDLLVQLARDGEERDLAVVEMSEGFQFAVPGDIGKGDWTLRVGVADRSTPTQNITLVRVE